MSDPAKPIWTHKWLFYMRFSIDDGAARKYHLAKMDLSREGYAIPHAGFVFLQYHHISST